ncbi:MAG: OmpA family protein [Lachnospiraceae bacterium]|nr:OmpA family protein [Lachnospiraceae bacterium]
MKNKRRNREAFAEHSYWQSYSDMMAALLLIFILMIAITLAIYRQKTNDLEETRLELNTAQSQLDQTIEDLELSKAELEKSNGELASSLAQLQQAYDQAALTQEELNNAYLEIENARQELTTTKQELQDIVGIRTDIIGALQSAFSNSSMKVDAQTGSITFSSDVLFRYNSASLTTDSKETLKNIIPMYLDVLLQDQFRDYIAEIIIEGHTDTDGSYQSNMKLSYERANAVADFCLNKRNGLHETKIEQLQKILTVNGKSWSSPVYQKDASGNLMQEVDMPASRRVEIKFRLKEDEMIEKIERVLEQGQISVN